VEPVWRVAHLAADAAEADDADSLARELHARELVPLPLARLERRDRLRDVPRQRLCATRPAHAQVTDASTPQPPMNLLAKERG
jgi:hypothetical protein